MKKRHILRAKCYDGENLTIDIKDYSFFYLTCLIGTPLERGWVTLWTATGALMRLNLGALVYWIVFEKDITNPLNDVDHYDNPLN